MLKKILQSLLNSKSHYKRYSSSSRYKRKHYGHHPSKYGHKYYQKKHRSGFFKSYSSS